MKQHRSPHFQDGAERGRKRRHGIKKRKKAEDKRKAISDSKR